MTVPKHSYIVLTEHAHAHHILVRYDDRPDWLQHIGTMRHKDRADSYVEIENSFVDDRTDYGDTVDDIGLPPDLPAEAPPSALPRVYGTTMPATTTADTPPTGRNDTVSPVNSSVGQAGRPDSSGIPDARPAEIPEGSAARKSLGSLPRSDQSEGSHGPGNLAGEAKGATGLIPSEQTAAPIECAPVDPCDENEVDLTPVVEARPLVDREAAVLAVYRRALVDGDWLSHARLAERSGVALGSLPAILESLTARGDLVREAKGQLPYLPGTIPVPLPRPLGTPASAGDGVIDGVWLTAQQRIVYDALVVAAAAGEPTPRNIDLAKLIGRDYDAAASSIIAALEKKGAIVRSGELGDRVVTIVHRGTKTAPRGTWSRSPGSGATVPVSQGDVAKIKFKDEVTPAPTPQARRRFTEHSTLEPELIKGLPADHPAVVEGRTLFPTSVVDAAASPRLLVDGHNSRKTGDCVTKGPWRGMPIYTLTLEERATCPTSCGLWAKCYGNAMPFARRHRHGDEFERLLELEIAALNKQHPDGFVVRLHILGDFYSVEYLAAWDIWLDRYPALHAFGYTAHQPGSEMGDVIAFMRDSRWDRFAIRTSAQDASLPTGARTIFRKPEAAVVAEGIVCPAQTDKTDCCGSCGLCWAPAAKDKTIVFIAHGRLGPAPQRAPEPSLAATTKPAGLKVGALPPVLRKASAGTRGGYNAYSRKRDPIPAGVKVETPEEFMARGGQIVREPAGHARGVGGEFSSPVVTARPKHGY